VSQPGRERAPQEITPVRVARATPGPLEGGAWPAAASARPTAQGRDASDAGDAAGRTEAAARAADLARDVRNVRRRALATLVYAGGAAGSLALGAPPDGAPLMIAPFLFCTMGTVVGAVWTAITARRVRHAGIGLGDALGSRWRDALARREARRPVARATLLHPVDDDVAASPYGAAVHRAMDDRAAIAELGARLGPADRAMIPDVLPTVEALVRRVAELATSLHHLSADASPARLAELDARIAEAERAPASAPDRERRLELLARQRASLADLLQRREQLSARLESATLVLQNMRLDLLRLSSSGIESALDEFTSTTREAGALSSEIGRALDVARELRSRDA